MTTTTTHPLAHTGRRVEFSYRRQPDLYLPGIITGPGELPGVVKIRLDGTRSNLHIPTDCPRLRYLDQVQPVPVLPMGRFKPTLADLGGFEYDGVPAFEIDEDIVIALTHHRRKAVEAMNAYYLLVLGIHDTPILGAHIRYGIGLFEWEPEDADTQWTMRLGRQGDDQAIPLHYLHP